MVKLVIMPRLGRLLWQHSPCEAASSLYNLESSSHISIYSFTMMLQMILAGTSAMLRKLATSVGTRILAVEGWVDMGADARASSPSLLMPVVVVAKM